MLASGGGIAGLSAAAFLSKSPDIELHVLEAKSEIRAIGAGIAIWKRYWDILEDMIDLGSECNVLGLKLSRWSEGELHFASGLIHKHTAKLIVYSQGSGSSESRQTFLRDGLR